MPSATDNQPASPSPPPSAPIALTPGPRATAFTTLYSNALTSTLRSVPYESFASCFPSIAENAPGALRAMHKGLVERLEGFARDEFEVILQERRVVERLNALEDVISDAKRRKARAQDGEEVPVPPHTLPAPALVSAHLAPLHRSQQSQLNAKLQTTASQNASLAEEIQQQKQEIDALLKFADTLVADLEGSGNVLAKEVDGSEGASSRAREAEVVMGGV